MPLPAAPDALRALRHAIKDRQWDRLPGLINGLPGSLDARELARLAGCAVACEMPARSLLAMASLDGEGLASWATHVARAAVSFPLEDRGSFLRAPLLWAQGSGARMDRAGLDKGPAATVWESLAANDGAGGDTLAALLEAPGSPLHGQSPVSRKARLQRLLFHSATAGASTFSVLWDAYTAIPPAPGATDDVLANLLFPLMMAQVRAPTVAGLRALDVITQSPGRAMSGMVMLIAVAATARVLPGYPEPPRSPSELAALVDMAGLLVSRGASPDLLCRVPDVRSAWEALRAGAQLDQSMPSPRGALSSTPRL